MKDAALEEATNISGSARLPGGGHRIRDWAGSLRADEWGVQLVVLWLAALVYYVGGDGSSPLPEIRQYLTQIALVSLWSVFILSGGYLLNDFFDRHKDKHKPGFKRRSIDSPRIVLAISVALLAVGIALATMLAANRWIMLVTMVQVVAIVTYSAPGLRLKERGVWGVVTAAAFQRIPNLLMVILAFPVQVPRATCLVLWLFVMGLLFICEHQLEDIDTDEKTGTRTWATQAGRARALAAVRFLYRSFWFTAVCIAIFAVIRRTSPHSIWSSGALVVLSGVFTTMLRGRYVMSRRLPHRQTFARGSPPRKRPGSRTAVIHGAGVAGLTAAIKLAEWGSEVEVHAQAEEPALRSETSPGSTSLQGVRFDPRYLENYLRIPLAKCFGQAVREAIYFHGRRMHMGSHHWLCERGGRGTSLDSFLLNRARSLGVRFHFSSPFTRGRESSSQATILATGLSTATYRSLEIPYTELEGYSALMPYEGEEFLLTYKSDYTHPDFAYVASFSGLLYALLFSRSRLSQDALRRFEDDLHRTEGLRFPGWSHFRGACPNVARQESHGLILAGTLSGMIDPLLLSGVSGALLSGGLAALTVFDPALARVEYRHFTRNFSRQIRLARLARSAHGPLELAPYILNAFIEPVGAIRKWVLLSS